MNFDTEISYGPGHAKKWLSIFMNREAKTSL